MYNDRSELMKLLHSYIMGFVIARLVRDMTSILH